MILLGGVLWCEMKELTRVAAALKNGIHAHYCPMCDKDIECQAVTHCSLPDTFICYAVHTAEQVKKAALKSRRSYENGTRSE